MDVRGSDVIGDVVDVDVEVDIDDVVDDVMVVVVDVVDVVVVELDGVVIKEAHVSQQSEILTSVGQAKKKHPDCRSPYRQSEIDTGQDII